MLAVIKTGGKQYIVKENQELQVELLDFDETKKSLVFEEVLLIADDKKTTIGQPIIEGAKVSAEVIDTVKADKVVIIKHQPKKHYRRKAGHRQKYLKVKITKIEA
jgi:large subunit ribosomal protein L21